MKICLVNDFFPPKVTGGSELFLKSLYDYLNSKGFDVCLLTQNSVKGETGFITYRINSSPLKFKHMKQVPGVTLPWLAFNKPLIDRINSIYKKEKPDILHINNLYHLSLAPLQSHGIPFVLDVHDYWPVCFSKDLFKDNKGFCTQKENWRCSFCLSKKFNFPLEPFFVPQLYAESAIKRRLLPKAKSVICHSNFVKDRLEERGYRSRVIPYPYFGKRFNGKKPAHNGLRLLFIGRLEYQKGADLLLKIAKDLRGKIDFRIDVLGEGGMKTMLDRKDLGIFTHGFTGDAKYDYLESADMLIAPSRWPEPFGIVSLEAMEYHVPVITLKSSGGLAEMVKNNSAGIVADESDIVQAVANLYNDKNQIQSFKKGRSNIEKYDKEKIFKSYIRAFENCLK